MALIWTIEKERKFQKVYSRLLKDNPELARNLLISRDTIYSVPDFVFWCALKQKAYERNATYQRRVRVRRYVRSMRFTFEDCLKGPWSLYLVTLTFNDSSLANNSLKSIQDARNRFMGAQCLDYIGCADYGKKNGRLHYHFIAVVEHSKLQEVKKGKKTFLQFKDSWPYGFHNISYVNNLKRQFYYVMKLSNYCFKNENSDNRPFHKRGVKHYVGATDYEEQMLIRELENHFLVNNPQDLRCQPKEHYNAPYCWVGDDVALTTYEAFTSRLTETTV